MQHSLIVFFPSNQQQSSSECAVYFTQFRLLVQTKIGWPVRYHKKNKYPVHNNAIKINSSGMSVPHIKNKKWNGLNLALPSVIIWTNGMVMSQEKKDIEKKTCIWADERPYRKMQFEKFKASR